VHHHTIFFQLAVIIAQTVTKQNEHDNLEQETMGNVFHLKSVTTITAITHKVGQKEEHNQYTDCIYDSKIGLYFTFNVINIHQYSFHQRI